MTTIDELFSQGKALLRSSAAPSLEAKCLLLKSLRTTEEDFLAHPDRKVSKGQEKHYHRLIARRLKGFPLAYLTGEKEFWSLDIRVFPGVFIPRPETELLVERVKRLGAKDKALIVDIGTGSGNIAIALAKELPDARIVATDTSIKSLKAARLNASHHDVSSITFKKGSLFSPLKKLHLEEKCDFIVSNPPYVSTGEWTVLPEDIRAFEPRQALVTGKTGLEFIMKLIQGSPKYLKPGGYLCFEIGFGQKQKVLSLLGQGWIDIECFDDLNGIPRVIKVQKKAGG